MHLFSEMLPFCSKICRRLVRFYSVVNANENKHKHEWLEMCLINLIHADN